METDGTSESIAWSKSTLVGINYTGFKCKQTPIKDANVSGVYASSVKWVCKNNTNNGTTNVKAF